jgi:mono/diheme cytochrome c family protein
MKYFFFSLIAFSVLVVGYFGFRGDKFSRPPLWIFPDMDEQDKVKAQTPSNFFEDGMGARKPVLGTVPRGAEPGVMPIEFGAGRAGYYFDGRYEGTFGNGLPKELKIESEADMTGLLGRGKEVYDIHCAICHGTSGNGNGVVATYLAKATPPVPVPTLLDKSGDQYPDGYIYEVITNGNGGLMGGYGHNILVRDRWAIVSYLRALQSAANK